jgi:hypothetical protein
MCEAQQRTIRVGIFLEGKRKRETCTSNGSIGNVDQYPTQDLALAAINGFRVSINEACNRQRQISVLIGDLVDHYIQTEFAIGQTGIRRPRKKSAETPIEH